MADKLNEIRERYGKQRLPRLFSGAVDDNRSEIRERYLGTGIAFGAGFGMVIGAGFGVAFGNLALGISFGICLGTGLGIAVGSSLGSKHAKRGQESSNTDGSRNA
jgi:hypothetical protein